MSAEPRKRLDLLLVDRGLAQSRERAQALILAGKVLVDDEPAKKAGTAYLLSVAIRLREPDHPYVSRGALKLIGALDTFLISVIGKVGLDIGASTGGFTQVLLERGASKVIAIDVGTNQMDWKIRSDPRVTCLEKTNARNLKEEDIRQKVDIVVMDVSFISLDKIFPAVFPLVHKGGDVVTLVKPQFEVGKADVGRGGIVTSDVARRNSLERITEFAKTLGWNRVQWVESPITGTDGNIEYLAHWRREHEG
ncbi:MAG: TlyA family RNA methyltransferase [Cryobacterium sp.]|nr:TlyA family RNA methyltransferase [Oligoflexia bacterium]